MRTNALTTSLAASVLSLFAAVSVASAQPIQPVAPVTGGLQLPPGDRCTVEALNVSGILNPDGSVFVPNVPMNQGMVRLRATCTDALGITWTGQSNAIAPVPGGAIDVGTIDFGASVLIAATLAITPQAVNLVGLGTSQPLSVGASYPNMTTADATEAATGTTYRTSNPLVATVGANGVVTAVGAGTAIISALNEGAMGLTTVTVRSAALQSITVVPASLTMVINPVLGTPSAQLRTRATLGNAPNTTIIDVTSGKSGTTYISSNLGVVRVSADGTVTAASPGTANITVTQPGSMVTVPVTVSPFSPSPFAVYNTPGNAYNVDIDGRLVFVADGPGGLQIIDAFTGTVVGKKAFVSPTSVTQTAFDVRVRSTLAAVALGPGGIALVDVVNPAQPVVLSVTSGAAVGDVRDLWVSGNRLYAASSAGLLVYNITNPALPALAGSLPGAVRAVAADTTRGIAVVLTAQPAVKVVRTDGLMPWPQVTLPLTVAVNHADDVALFGTSAYVANGRNGLREVDVTNPAAPFLKLSSTLNFNALGVAVRQTNQGLVIAAADNLFVNAVPLFNAQLANTININFASFSDANSDGVALGDGFGVVAVGYYGIQVFRTQQITDNAGIDPVASLTQPTNDTRVLAGSVSMLDATATDDVNVSFVDFRVDGLSVGIDDAAPFSAAFQAGASCSTHTVQAWATDVHGNVGESLTADVKVLCQAGETCGADEDCTSNNCVNSTCQGCAGVVHVSCDALNTACPGLLSGPYTIDPDDAGPGASFQVYCDMVLAGGGWTLAAKLTNQDTKHWVNSATSWTSTSVLGSTIDLTPGQDAKSMAWSTVVANEILLTDDDSHANGSYIETTPTTTTCLGNTTLSDFFTDALTGYPTASGQTEHKKCPTFNNYVPEWTFEPNYLDQGPTAPSHSLNSGYLAIAKSDENDTQAVISFYGDGEIFEGPTYEFPTGEFEADVGLGASEANAAAFGTFGEAQDIGGPLSCNTDDATCAAQYPQTVFLFVR